MSATAQHLRFLGVSALLFIGSAAATIVSSASMSGMGMPMPGGWTMSMTWMRMPGQSWLGAASSFVAMWAVMMVAMMLPSLVPMLLRYRLAVEHVAAGRLDRLTALVGAGYFGVWTALGLAVFPLGVALADVEMRQRALAQMAPAAISLIVAAAGASQFTAWKGYHLACCRDVPARGSLPAEALGALRHGVRLGMHCSYSSAGLMVLLFAAGLMDLRAMAAVMVAVSVERLTPGGERVARATGAVIVAIGVILLVRAS